MCVKWYLIVVLLSISMISTILEQLLWVLASGFLFYSPINFLV